MKPWYNAQQNATTLQQQVRLALEHLWSGQPDKARDVLEHAVGYRQTNKDWQDGG